MCCPSKSVTRRRQHCLSNSFGSLIWHHLLGLGVAFLKQPQGTFSQKQTTINLIQRHQTNLFSKLKKILLILRSWEVQRLSHLESQCGLLIITREGQRGQKSKGPTRCSVGRPNPHWDHFGVLAGGWLHGLAGFCETVLHNLDQSEALLTRI